MSRGWQVKLLRPWVLTLVASVLAEVEMEDDERAECSKEVTALIATFFDDVLTKNWGQNGGRHFMLEVGKLRLEHESHETVDDRDLKKIRLGKVAIIPSKI